MRFVRFSLLALTLSGCVSTATHDLLEREVGRTIADVTLVAGPPARIADLANGNRAFQWDRPVLVPTGGGRCAYTLYAESVGRRESLAAWRVVAIEPAAPGCVPLQEKRTLF